MVMKPVLSETHLRGLKNHVYKAVGISITEHVYQPFWRWLVTQFPLWLAPNLLTFSGLLINVCTCLAVLVFDFNSEGTAPRAAYVACALGLFIYQSLDAIDGKQARRTGTNNQLGELFDHGCDALSTFLVVLASTSAVALNEWPYVNLLFVLVMEVLNFVYHWQTYVSGTLYFKQIDCTEAQLAHIGVVSVTAVWGVDAWTVMVPYLGVSLKAMMVVIVIASCLINLISATRIILTQGVGKNGATVADTSVLSPVIPMVFFISVTVYYALYSPAMMLEKHSVLFFVVMVGPIVKFVLFMMIAGMCKTPLPLFDYIMVGPLLAVINLVTGCHFSEYYLLLVLALYVIYNILSMCVVVVIQVCKYLNISCFTIPYPPPSLLNK